MEDVVTYFDNVDKYVIKDYQGTSQKTKKVDIIAASLHLSLGGNKLKTNAILKASNWHNKKPSEEEEAMQKIVSDFGNIE